MAPLSERSLEHGHDVLRIGHTLDERGVAEHSGAVGGVPLRSHERVAESPAALRVLRVGVGCVALIDRDDRRLPIGGREPAELHLCARRTAGRRIDRRPKLLTGL